MGFMRLMLIIPARFYDRQLKINALRMGFMNLMSIILAICMGFMTGNLKPVQIAVRIKRRL